jgi:predicted lysophospholipase L1 biosynthesis ABC-type transport system permease subunit
MTALLGVTGMLSRGGTPADRARGRLMVAGSVLATWFLFAGANILALRGELDDRLGPISDRGTRGGSALVAALLVLPVTAFLYQSSRLAATDRDRRLSALRLAGATPSQVRRLGVLETTRTGVIGAAIGAVSYLLLQWTGRRLLLGPGSGADVNVPPVFCLAAIALVVLAAAVSGLLVGRHVIATPLAVTVRAGRRTPRWYAFPLVVPGLVLLHMVRDVTDPRCVIGLALFAGGLLGSQSGLVALFARTAGRRARSAETLLAARALEADARPWGRTLSVVSLAVMLGSAAGWTEAEVVNDSRITETFFLSSFVIVELVLLVTIAIAASALMVHQAEYLLEHGPVLAALQALGTPETTLRRVLIRQALIAATPLCAIAALLGLLALMRPYPLGWFLWATPHTVLVGALGVLGAALAAFFSRRRLRRTVAPVRLRVE